MTSARFQRWHGAGFTSELLPIIPPGAPITAGSNVREHHRGKVPGVKTAAGTWSGLGGRWPDQLQATEADVRKWHGWKCNVGLQGRKFPGLDVDVDDATLAETISALATEYLGAGPIRARSGSPRVLHVFKLDGEALRKVRLAFTDKAGNKHAVELLAYGQQYVVEGPHPAGGEYVFKGEHPCDVGPDNLPPINAADVERFFQVLGDKLAADGYGTEAVGNATLGAGTRKTIDDPTLWAPSPADVLAALKAWPNTLESHDDLVAALVAIKAALGPTRDEHYSDVEAWALGYGDNDEAYVRKTWDSITDAALGWDWLSSKAGAGTIAAQSEFDDGEAPAGMDTPDPIELARESMTERFVYCVGVDRYVDLKTGDLLPSKAFNALNTGIAQFGRSGVNSAEGVFQNLATARKVATATYRPGVGPLVDEDVNGTLRPAVNLYRPSTVKPNLGATEETARPWLDHVTTIFGEPGAPAREHFLDYAAFLFQRPGVKINHAPVLLGAHGIGKDTVLEPIRLAIGGHNHATIGPDELLASFNSGWIERQLIVVNEVMNFVKREMTNRLKPLLAAPPEFLQVNRKNVPQYFIPNICNVIMLTNFDDALSIENGDRRYWVHQCLIDEAPPESYFIPLWTWIKNDGAAHVAGYLLKRDLSAFNPKAAPPMTDAKAEMIEASAPLAVRWLEEQFDEGGQWRGREMLTVREVIAAGNDFNAPAKVAETLRERYVVAALKRHGFAAIKGKYRIGGATGRVWTTHPRPGELANIDAALLVRRYENDQKKKAS